MSFNEGEIQKILQKFESISLNELNQLKLMKRQDTKHVFSINKLEALLDKVSDEYKVLEIENKRVLLYNTDYFDTPNFTTYIEHHNKRLNRYKIRLRRYAINNEYFLEIKMKNNKGQTVKKRIASDAIDSINNESFEFIKQHINISENNLKKSSSNSFNRITLASFKTKERITIDYNLNLHVNHKSKQLNHIAIAELKSEREKAGSSFANALKELKIYSRGFSKYCIGMALLQPNIKKNSFKEDLMFINKLQ